MQLCVIFQHTGCEEEAQVTHSKCSGHDNITGIMQPPYAVEGPYAIVLNGIKCMAWSVSEYVSE